MYYRIAAENFAKITFASTSILGGITGFYKGIDIAVNNWSPHYDQLPICLKMNENLYAFLLISGSTIFGSIIGPPLILVSPFFKLSPTYHLKNIISNLRNNNSS
jgi:hypothetical protein